MKQFATILAGAALASLSYAATAEAQVNPLGNNPSSNTMQTNPTSSAMDANQYPNPSAGEGNSATPQVTTGRSIGAPVVGASQSGGSTSTQGANPGSTGNGADVSPYGRL